MMLFVYNNNTCCIYWYSLIIWLYDWRPHFQTNVRTQKNIKFKTVIWNLQNATLYNPSYDWNILSFVLYGVHCTHVSLNINRPTGGLDVRAKVLENFVSIFLLFICYYCYYFSFFCLTATAPNVRLDNHSGNVIVIKTSASFVIIL